jgi:hypothetical protein
MDGPKPFARGISLGGPLDDDRPGAGAWLDDAQLDTVRAAGFDAGRLPVKWSAHQAADPPYAVDAASAGRVDRVVEAALERGLRVVVRGCQPRPRRDRRPGPLEHRRRPARPARARRRAPRRRGAVLALRAARSGATVGITLNLAPVRPATPSAEDAAAAHRRDGHLNRWFLDALLRGAYPEDTLALYAGRVGPFAPEPADLETIAAPLDFLGVNYYRPEYVRLLPPGVRARRPGGRARSASRRPLRPRA